MVKKSFLFNIIEKTHKRFHETNFELDFLAHCVFSNLTKTEITESVQSSTTFEANYKFWKFSPRILYTQKNTWGDFRFKNKFSYPMYDGVYTLEEIKTAIILSLRDTFYTHLTTWSDNSTIIMPPYSPLRAVVFCWWTHCF